MPGPYIINPSFFFGGLDLSADHQLIGPTRSTYIKNIRKLKSEAITEREGYKAVDNEDVGGAYGTFMYEKTNPTTFEVTKELVVCASKLFKKVDYDFTINYGGTAQAVVEVLVDPDNEVWKLKLYVDGAVVLDFDLGVGFDELTPVTINDLDTAITAVTDFTATVATGSGGLPAAFLDSTQPTLIEGGSQVINISARVQVNQPTGASDPFAGHHAMRNTDQFENITSFEENGNIYFCSGFDEQKKYDGKDCYRAGAPEGTKPVLTGAGAGTLPAGTYQYISSIVQVDANDNEVEGDESEAATIVSGVMQNINVQVTNVLNTSGFNTDCAIVAGAQVTVNTITVDNGSGGSHTMKEGQRAYFYDAVSASYVVRNITAVAATTITVDGAAVTVADNAVISNNLRIRIRRTVASGSIFKENVDIPNNSFTANQTYNDSKTDANLGANFESPSEAGLNHGLPPKAAYCAIYNGVPVLGRLSGDPLGFAWASPDGPEYYPDDFQDFIKAGKNTAITGMAAQDRFLWIHVGNEPHLLTGNLLTAQFSTSKKPSGTGCVAHATIVETDIGLVWLGEGGVYATKDGAEPIRIGSEIAAAFEKKALTEDRRLRLKRAVAYWDDKLKLYVLFIPAESTQGGENYANSRSRTFALDLFQRPTDGGIRREWFEWSNINMAGGCVYDNEEVYWTERSYSFFDGNTSFKLHKRLYSNSIYDQVDHNQAIEWEIRPGWWHGELPTVDKKFIHIAMFSTDPEVSPYCTFTVKTEKNFIEGVADAKFTQSFGIAGSGPDGFGFGAWGFFPWGNPKNTVQKPRRLNNKPAMSYRATFKGGAIYTKLVLSSYQFQVSSPYKIDMKEVKNT